MRSEICTLFVAKRPVESANSGATLAMTMITRLVNKSYCLNAMRSTAIGLPRNASRPEMICIPQIAGAMKLFPRLKRVRFTNGWISARSLPAKQLKESGINVSNYSSLGPEVEFVWNEILRQELTPNWLYLFYQPTLATFANEVLRWGCLRRSGWGDLTSYCHRTPNTPLPLQPLEDVFTALDSASVFTEQFQFSIYAPWNHQLPQETPDQLRCIPRVVSKAQKVHFSVLTADDSPPPPSIDKG